MHIYRTVYYISTLIFTMYFSVHPVVLIYSRKVLWNKQERCGLLPRHFELPPISAKKGWCEYLAGGGYLA